MQLLSSVLDICSVKKISPEKAKILNLQRM